VSVVALHHEEFGPPDGPPLLLGSSLGTTLAMFAPLVTTLKSHRRLICFDHRGHGGSPVSSDRSDIADLGADVLALLDRLEIDRASYAGVSLGGMVGLWLGAYAPERIERLVCVCTAAHLPPAEAWATRAAAVRAAGTVAVVADPILARWLTPAFAERNPDVVLELGTMLRGCSPVGYAACCEVIERLDLRDQLSSILAPTLVIGAAQDEAIPPEHSRSIAAVIAGAELEVLANGAHLAAIECATEVSALIEGHLKGGAR
jgi:3-oxoadipate enol-lactonase